MTVAGECDDAGEDTTDGITVSAVFGEGASGPGEGAGVCDNSGVGVCAVDGVCACGSDSGLELGLDMELDSGSGTESDFDIGSECGGVSGNGFRNGGIAGFCSCEAGCC